MVLKYDFFSQSPSDSSIGATLPENQGKGSDLFPKIIQFCLQIKKFRLLAGGKGKGIRPDRGSGPTG
jgi:hypothetical protein